MLFFEVALWSRLQLDGRLFVTRMGLFGSWSRRKSVCYLAL